VTELLDASGQVQRVVSAPSTFDETGAAWSPDGTHIAYLDAAGLHVQNLDGSDDRLLVSHPRCDNDQCLGNLDFAWSPDGTRIIVGGAGHWTNQLLVVDVASGTMRSIAPEFRYTEYADPTWSPNGKWITYTRESGHAGYAGCCQTVLTMLGRPLVDARNVWTSRGGTAPARFAFGVPDGLSLFSLAPQP